MSDQPEFEVTFVVNESDAESYENFIVDLRNRVGDPDNQSAGLPVLPPQENPPRLFFDVILRADHGDVRLRIQRDNLYVIGYQANNRWYEIGNAGDQRLINNSTPLGFGGSYTTLQDRAGQRRENMNLNYSQLNGAVNQLLPQGSQPTSSVQAQSFLVFAQMVSESVRFRDIQNIISANYYVDTDPRDRLRIATLENA